MLKVFLTGLSGVLFLLSCSRSGDLEPSTNRVNRKAVFEIFTNQDYSDKFYKYSFAEIQLSIARSDRDGRKVQTLWDTTFSSRNWSEYPQEKQKFILEKTAAFNATKEMLTVSTLIYFTIDNKASLATREENWMDTTGRKRFVVSF